MSKLIIITGCPGTGKSYFARLLAERFPQLVVLSYDHFKEVNWDRCGFDNAEEKAALNRRSLQEFYAAVAEELRLGRSVLIEYPFNQSHAPALQRIIDETGAQAFTLYLHGDMETMYRRSIARDGCDGRHPGHLFNVYHRGRASGPAENCQPSLEDFLAGCRKKNYDIRLGENIPVDVTSFAHIPYEEIVRTLQIRTGLQACPAAEEEHHDTGH